MTMNQNSTSTTCSATGNNSTCTATSSSVAVAAAATATMAAATAIVTPQLSLTGTASTTSGDIAAALLQLQHHHHYHQQQQQQRQQRQQEGHLTLILQEQQGQHLIGNNRLNEHHNYINLPTNWSSRILPAEGAVHQNMLHHSFLHQYHDDVILRQQPQLQLQQLRLLQPHHYQQQHFQQHQQHAMMAIRGLVSTPPSSSLAVHPSAPVSLTPASVSITVPESRCLGVQYWYNGNGRRVGSNSAIIGTASASANSIVDSDGGDMDSTEKKPNSCDSNHPHRTQSASIAVIGSLTPTSSSSNVTAIQTQHRKPKIHKAQEHQQRRHDSAKHQKQANTSSQQKCRPFQAPSSLGHNHARKKQKSKSDKSMQAQLIQSTATIATTTPASGTSTLVIPKQPTKSAPQQPAPSLSGNHHLKNQQCHTPPAQRQHQHHQGRHDPFEAKQASKAAPQRKVPSLSGNHHLQNHHRHHPHPTPSPVDAVAPVTAAASVGGVDVSSSSPWPTYRVVALHRTSLQRPWGFSISLISGRFILGATPPACTDGMYGSFSRSVVNCYSIHPCFNQEILNTFTTPGLNVSTCVRYLISIDSGTSNKSENPNTLSEISSGDPLLLSGDCLLSVNGTSTANFTTLAQLTDILRRATFLQLVLLRVPTATMKAREALNNHSNTIYNERNPSKQDNPFLTAAVAASDDLKKFIHNICTLSVLPLQPPQPPSLQPAAIATSWKVRTNNLHESTSAVAATTQYRPHVPTQDITTKRKLFTPQKEEDSLYGEHQNQFFSNPSFRDETDEKPIPYDDNWEDEPDEGKRAALFLNSEVEKDFPLWLGSRKRKWRQDRYTLSREERKSADLFLNPEIERNFPQWLESRKRQWRKYRPDHSSDFHEGATHDTDKCLEEYRGSSTVPVDFWTSQGYGSFDKWLHASTSKWKRNYSWNLRKRKLLEHDAEEVVHLELASTNDPEKAFGEWLRVRKNQWKILRRKRQRQQQGELEHLLDSQVQEDDETLATMGNGSVALDAAYPTPIINGPTSIMPQQDLLVIDAILEEEEMKKKARLERPPFDVSFLFDASLGCPDDAVVHILKFLDSMEYGKLLCIDRATRKALGQREDVWRQLCPSHWTLPRRTRKPWHVIFFKQLRSEKELAQQRCDGLLSRISNTLLLGDRLQSIEKLVTKAEKDFNFDINYNSGVVCERNSILNLAAIHQRHKVVKWLVETKKADIETHDRGNFTPLLNAAYAGDRYLVRLLLQHGADRSKVGLFHYTKPLCSPEFKGMTADGWAEARGFPDLAKLIRIGL